LHETRTGNSAVLRQRPVCESKADPGEAAMLANEVEERTEGRYKIEQFIGFNTTCVIHSVG
jgi:hypothetical protein